MKELWFRLQMARGFFQLVRNPERTDLIFKALKMLARAKDQKPIQAIIKAARENTPFSQMIDSGYMPKKPNLNDLAQMPEGSFGKEVYNHMAKNNINFDLFPDEEPELPIEYFSQRMYWDHDLWHVLLNYHTDVADELALQAFNVAQLRTPFGAMIISGGILNLLRKDPLAAADAVGRVADGYQRGKKAKFLLGLKLHEMFERPLAEVRELAGV